MLLNEKKNHYLRAGLVLTGLMAALALLGCVWTPYPPTAMSGSEKFAAPCLRQLGMDNHPHRGGYKDKVLRLRQDSDAGQAGIRQKGKEKSHGEQQK